jgi:hypothetical protein
MRPNPTSTAPPPMPTMVTSPPGSTTCTAVAMVGVAPTKSNTACTPRPPVIARMPSAAAASLMTVWCAPTWRASSSFSSFTSRAMTVAPLRARRIWIPTWPSPPVPMTTAYVPAPSFGREVLMAWYGVRPASVSDTFSTGSRSPSGTRWRGSSTIMYSAMEPGAPSPGGWIPSAAAFSQ